MKSGRAVVACVFVMVITNRNGDTFELGYFVL
jgi:hypothetical protein